MRKSINQVVAAALQFYMAERWNQTTLGKASKVAPNTIGNAMHPTRREPSKSGKEPSIKVTELDQIARALDVPVADLVSDLTDDERRQRQRERAAEHYKRHGVLPAWAPQPTGKRDGTNGVTADLYRLPTRRTSGITPTACNPRASVVVLRPNRD